MCCMRTRRKEKTHTRWIRSSSVKRLFRSVCGDRHGEAPAENETLMRDQNIISSLRLSWFNSVCKLRHHHRRFLFRSDQRVDIAIIPFGNCVLRVDEMDLLQVEQKAFVPGGNDLITQVV